MNLQPRQQAILAAVIERYVENAEPVGSSALAGDAGFRARFGTISTATIRNELAELENLGLLMQPHTSAGRVPTDAGYRFYVNQMLSPRPLSSREKSQIQNQIVAPASSIEDALRDATLALAQLSGYPALATLPHAGRDTMRQVQLSPIPPHRLLLVLLTQTGRVENRLFEVGPDARQPDATQLNTVVNFLNEQLRGRSVAQVRALSFESVSGGLHDESTLQLARRAWEQVRVSANDLGDERLVVQGVVTLLDEPEFSEIEHARAAMRWFQNADALSDLLNANAMEVGEGAPFSHAIVIGREHARHDASLADNTTVERLAFVGIAYGVGGEVLGTVGVMGPKRMKYADAVSLVPALAARLQISLESL